MSNKEDIKQRILKLFSERDIDCSKINDDTLLVHSYIIDSMKLVNILLELEEIFNIEIDFENIEFAELTSVNGLTNYIYQAISK